MKSMNPLDFPLIVIPPSCKEETNNFRGIVPIQSLISIKLSLKWDLNIYSFIYFMVPGFIKPVGNIKSQSIIIVYIHIYDSIYTYIWIYKYKLAGQTKHFNVVIMTSYLWLLKYRPKVSIKARAKRGSLMETEGLYFNNQR